MEGALNQPFCLAVKKKTNKQTKRQIRRADSLVSFVRNVDSWNVIYIYGFKNTQIPVWTEPKNLAPEYPRRRINLASCVFFI